MRMIGEENKSELSTTTAQAVAVETVGPKTLKEFYNTKLKTLVEVQELIQPLSIFEIEDLSKISHIPASEIEKFATIAVLNGAGFGFRPVNPEAERVIEKYGAVGKDFSIKGKSASEGPIAGLVPVDPAFSKLGSNNEKDKIHKFQHINEEALRKKDPVSKENLYGTYTPKNDAGERYYGFVGKEGEPLKDKNGAIVYAHKRDHKYINMADGSEISVPKHYKSKIVTVMGYAEKGKNNEKIVRPATADADQLTQGIMDKEDYEKQYQDEKINKATDEELPELKKKEIKEIGSTNAQGAALTRTLIAETKETGMVRHADESGNPFPENFADGEPHLFIVPSPIKDENDVITGMKAKGIICKNEQEIIDLFNHEEMKEFGFKVNPLWGWRKNEETDKLEKDPECINAQVLSLRRGHIAEEGNKAKLAAFDDITKTLRNLGTAKVEGKKEEIKRQQNELDIKQKLFIDKYNEDPLPELTERRRRENVPIVPNSYDDICEFSNKVNVDKNTNNSSIKVHKEYNNEHGDQKKVVQPEAIIEGSPQKVSQSSPQATNLSSQGTTNNKKEIPIKETPNVIATSTAQPTIRVSHSEAVKGLASQVAPAELSKQQGGGKSHAENQARPTHAFMPKGTGLGGGALPNKVAPATSKPSGNSPVGNLKEQEKTKHMPDIPLEILNELRVGLTSATKQPGEGKPQGENPKGKVQESRRVRENAFISR